MSPQDQFTEYICKGSQIDYDDIHAIFKRPCLEEMIDRDGGMCTEGCFPYLLISDYIKCSITGDLTASSQWRMGVTIARTFNQSYISDPISCLCFCDASHVMDAKVLLIELMQGKLHICIVHHDIYLNGDSELSPAQVNHLFLRMMFGKELNYRDFHTIACRVMRALAEDDDRRRDIVRALIMIECDVIHHHVIPAIQFNAKRLMWEDRHTDQWNRMATVAYGTYKFASKYEKYTKDWGWPDITYTLHNIKCRCYVMILNYWADIVIVDRKLVKLDFDITSLGAIV